MTHKQNAKVDNKYKKGKVIIYVHKFKDKMKNAPLLCVII